MSFQNQLKRLRKANQMTQKQLAEQLEISQTAISLYERGEREPDMQLLSRLCSLFQVDMNTLLDCQAVPGNRAAVDTGAVGKEPTEQQELNSRDQRDIGKKLRSMLDLFDSEEALMFDGEPLDEETRELLKESYRSQLEMTKRLAKMKFTAKKYRSQGTKEDE